MSGGYISCGKFMGDDKSGSAYQGVLEGIVDLGNPDFAEVAAQLQNQLARAEEYLEIPQPSASKLLPAIESYRLQLEQRLGGPCDPFDAIEREDEDLDPLDAKWGKGIGWRYYCVLDLEQALKLSESTGEPVVVSFD